MSNPNSVLFSVKRRKDYQQWRQKEFSVKELGRHNHEDLVDLETWSRESGDPVPEACKIPFVYPPRTLPLSLKLNRCKTDVNRMYFYDPTDGFTSDYEIKLPPKEIPEFIPELFSIGKILAWAMREHVDLGQVDIFILSRALRDIASTATIGRWNGDWEYAVFCYKGKIFIDRLVSNIERYWKDGLDTPPDRDYWRFVLEPPCVPMLSEGENVSENTKFFVPYFDFPRVKKKHLELLTYGKKFEDVLRSGGPGDPLYDGVNEETSIKQKSKYEMGKCDKLVSLCDHRIMTATRISCQEPSGQIDSQENHVEMKTMYPQSKGGFAKFKSLSLWIHCALVGVDAVYCGFRCKEGKLNEIKKYTMNELAELGQNYWSPTEILTFLDTFLSWLKEKLNKDAVRNKRGEAWLNDLLHRDEGSTFTLSYSGDERIRLEPADHPELRKIVTERYSHVVKSDCDWSDSSSDIPDNWDDSD